MIAMHAELLARAVPGLARKASDPHSDIMQMQLTYWEEFPERGQGSNSRSR